MVRASQVRVAAKSRRGGLRDRRPPLIGFSANPGHRNPRPRLASAQGDPNHPFPARPWSHDSICPRPPARRTSPQWCRSSAPRARSLADGEHRRGQAETGTRARSRRLLGRCGPVLPVTALRHRTLAPAPVRRHSLILAPFGLRRRRRGAVMTSSDAPIGIFLGRLRHPRSTVPHAQPSDSNPDTPARHPGLAPDIACRRGPPARRSRLL